MNKKEIIILGFKFKLIFSDKLSDEELGRCDCTYQKIFINPNQGEDSIRDTLLHEIIHAISYLMGLTDDDPEEAFVGRIATGLRIVVNDNPWLVPVIFTNRKIIKPDKS